MKKGKSSGQLFWQTILSIVLGVITGVIIIGLTQRPEAQAVVNSTLPQLTQSHGINLSPMQILPALSERMTILVMGVDSNGRDADRFTATRSDTMILVSLDPTTRKVGMVSIPRDSRVQIAGNHGTDKINAAHAFGGPKLTVQTVSENFGVPIDHFVCVDTQALKDLCHLLGPVEVLVEKDMHYHDWAAHLHIDLKPGLQTLSPDQVEQYVRFRHDARGDIGRIERQQWFFRAASKKMQDPQFLLRLPELIRMAHQYVQTDLSLEDMARVASFGKDIHSEDVVTATLPGLPDMINGCSYWVPDMDGSRAVFNRILGFGGSGNFVRETASKADTTSGDEVELALNTTKPLVVAIKFPKGSETAASNLEKTLTDAGYNVRYKWLMPQSDCQHEQIIQMSAKADDFSTEKMRTAIPDLKFWPVVLSLESRPFADFTVVVTPETRVASATVESGSPIQRAIVPN